MQTKEQEIAQRVIMLLKLDAKNLFRRIKDRHEEYMTVFSAKRTRHHFPEVFQTRYPGAGIKELMLCSLDTITALEQFYTEVDEMHWYVMHTEDMPVTVEDATSRYIKKLETYYQTLTLYLDAELGINQEEEETKNLTDLEATSKQQESSVEHLFFDDNVSDNSKNSADEQN